jgi:hypothetical protein
MAAFKDGENSTDPRRCTANSRQTGKRCKNASIPGGSVCRFHGGAAPQTKEAAEKRFAHLVDPAIDQLAMVLRSGKPSIAAAAARDILDRAGLKRIDHLLKEKPLDLRKLSTDELIVLEAITRKARGQVARELTEARELTRELAHQLRRGRHSALEKASFPDQHE